MKISIILTSYNHERFIGKSIESVINQTYKDYELIIVDDCSTDNSWKIICEYKEKYPQIITIRNEKNWGSGVIENIVQNYAKGDYIAIHHSDDIWTDDKLEKQIVFLEKHTENVAVFTNAQAIDDNGNKYLDEEGFYYNLFTVNNRSRQEWLNYFFYKGNCLCHPSILVRKDVYMENGFFKKGLKQIPDFVKWIQICKKYEIYVLPDRLVKFRIHSEGKNTSGMRKDTQIRSTIEWYWMLEEYKEITDKEEFFKVFPETKKYCESKEFVPEYVLGKICTRDGVQPYTRLFGNTLLFSALNDPYKAKILKEQYHYTIKDFTTDTGRYDIFGILPEKFEQERTIYIDLGEGWECCKAEKYCLNQSEKFMVHGKVDIPQDIEYVKLRFDPAEGVMIRSQIKKILINGESASYIGENAFCSVGGIETFVTLDPIYTIKIPEKFNIGQQLSIIIEGTIYRLSGDEIATTVMSDMYAKRESLFESEFKNRELCRNNEELNKQLESKNNELALVNEELYTIKNTFLYRLTAKIYSLFRKK